MNERRTARRLALDVLYEAEIRDRLPAEALVARGSEGWVVAGPEDEVAEEDPVTPSPAVMSYAAELVEGVQEHQAHIDELIVRYADRWAITRMPVVDRTLLRIAIFELLWGDDIPVAVAINEAVEIGKSLSTEDSGRFINGLLGRIAESERPAGE
ncbi:MAG: transcription antitermination factor NusB [Actinomycetota bacterium]|nr:transcription antitermination factor NusB [Actinomycetota bacterium]